MITKADISFIRSLSDKRNREEVGLFVAEGRKMVAEAAASGFTVRRIIGTEDFSDIAGCEIVPRKTLERMSGLKTPQGVIAVMEIPRHGLPENPGNELTLALDGVQDPGNLGTIIRTADWFGIGDVICSVDSADRFNLKAVQATMGAIFRVRICYADLPAVLKAASGKGVPVFGAFLEGENIYAADLPADGGIIVLGNEGNGISKEAAVKITRKLSIPPYPPVQGRSESLNVAAAAAVICAEFRRRAGGGAFSADINRNTRIPSSR